jgi:hypothetical protein
MRFATGLFNWRAAKQLHVRLAAINDTGGLAPRMP